MKITDHAIVRYLQRVKGVDIDALKKEIVPNDVRKQIEELGGGGSFPVANSHILKLVGFKVTTVIEY